jgi:hypothetical protein
MMIARLFSPRRLLIGSLIFLWALLAAGCTTTFWESSGRMANEGSNHHVKPYEGAGAGNNGNAEAVRPAVRIPQFPIRGIAAR